MKRAAATKVRMTLAAAAVEWPWPTNVEGFGPSAIRSAMPERATHLQGMQQVIGVAAHRNESIIAPLGVVHHVTA